MNNTIFHRERSEAIWIYNRILIMKKPDILIKIFMKLARLLRRPAFPGLLAMAGKKQQLFLNDF
jgi:hypothetical protein